MYEPWVCPQRVILFQPGRSLLTQFAVWRERHPQFALLCLPASSAPRLACVLDRETPLVINATDQPEAAAALVQSLKPLVSRLQVCVYTERALHELEREIRRNGIPYVDGPMTTDEWDAVILRPQAKRHAELEAPHTSIPCAPTVHVSAQQFDPTEDPARDQQ